MMSALSKFVGYLSRFFQLTSRLLVRANQAATARRAMSTFVYVDGEGDAFAGRPGRERITLPVHVHERRHRATRSGGLIGTDE